MEKRKRSLGVLILAAGKGTRMRSETPKVLHKMLEEPILYYPLRAAADAGFSDVAVVVGSGGGYVSSWVGEEFPESSIIWQHEQKGTAHAAKLAQQWWSAFDDVMILPGDAPLITASTLSAFAASHQLGSNVCSFLSFMTDDPAGYGRVVRGGEKICVVEHRDATDEQLMIKEVNSGMYIFDTKALAAVIDRISSGNAQGEYYLPDALSLAADDGGSVNAVLADSPDEFLGVNDQLQLAKAAGVMRRRIVEGFMINNGLQCMDPESVWIGPKVKIGRGAVIHPSVQLWGSCVVEDGAFIGSFTVLRNSTVHACANLKGSVRMNDSVVGERASAGPFAFMREHAELMENAHVGRFVEIKKSSVGKDSKVPHLSYIGDAQIGEGTNIGAGTITCNYDGEKKNPTKIGRGCLIGSDTMFVAPVEVGDCVSTAAGSVITENIPDGALAIARARQINKNEWSRQQRQKNKTDKT
ncbi:MAG: bifunctional UDP-N-acetylglucosamine diphosphorylase/glucosamine-1-phosphate N-acetyltransferase GlmU [Synergistes sp.]|nr:bifunctional UDP-N-acetylglucosamine diphosphorylase/glucosamine-1-phosphate N-acetyltransferase GlmU [Synergistes sp.]